MPLCFEYYVFIDSSKQMLLTPPRKKWNILPFLFNMFLLRARTLIPRARACLFQISAFLQRLPTSISRFLLSCLCSKKRLIIKISLGKKKPATSALKVFFYTCSFFLFVVCFDATHGFFPFREASLIYHHISVF